VARSGERIKLKHIRCGGKIFTTEANLDKFFQQLADADAVHFDDVPFQAPTVKAPRTASQRERGIAAAERELANSGL
jgi:tRNA isopentenyl-2-thiomethyl-A-37 hydroxylase MiaE